MALILCWHSDILLVNDSSFAEISISFSIPFCYNPSGPDKAQKTFINVVPPPQALCIIPLDSSHVMTSTVSLWSVPTPPAVALALTVTRGITRYLD